MLLALLIVLLACPLLGLAQQLVPATSRIDCHPAPNATKKNCAVTPGCIWDSNSYPGDLSVPPCYFPPKTGYQLHGKPKGEKLTLTNPTVQQFYGKIFPKLSFNTTNYGEAVNIRITTSSETRYEPLVKIPRTAIKSTEKLKINISKTSNDIFYFRVERLSTGIALWDTSIGGLLFAPKYIQIAAYLPTKKIYGLGEHVHNTLMHNLTKYTTWGMFARDIFPSADKPSQNLYGVHPFYLGLEHDNKAHGVLIWNSNAQEVTLGPAPHLVYRTIGGMLDITFFPGPTPADVIQQYLSFIGKPFLPAYFALGFQICRWGYKSLDEMKMVVDRIQKAGVPLDITYADIDYMERYLDFTVGKEKWGSLKDYTDKLHKDGLHLFLIFDPGIQVTENVTAMIDALEMKAGFIEWENAKQVNKAVQDMYPLMKNKNVLLSVVWPDWHVAYPDFLNNNTVKWWIDQFQKFYEKVPLDGIWIDMNEPSAFGTNVKHPWYYDDTERPAKIKPLWCDLSNEWEDVPYKTINVYQYGSDSHLCTKTVCMYARTNSRRNTIYDTKNLYGIAETIATNKVVQQVMKKRGAIVTRSTFVSSGHYGSHWLGDNLSRWPDMRASLIGVQEFNMFGIPLVGADICGFIENTNEELCLRWHQLGAIYPFCRNHNSHGNIPQDPAVWPTVASAARQALLFRYHYLPYLYTLMFEASLNGTAVARPVFFEFTNDPNTHQLSHQVMWGSAIMYIPVIYKGAESVSGYLPPAATWYSIRDVDYGYRMDKTGFTTFASPTTVHIPVFIRGGYIVPRQKPEMTTTASRKNPFELLIAMVYDKDGTALPSNGQFIWDDGESLPDEDRLADYNYHHWQLHYTADTKHATLVIKHKKIANNVSTPSLDIIDVLGYQFNPGDSVQLNGKPVHVHFSYQPTTKRLVLQKTNFIIMNGSEAKITLKWAHTKDYGTNDVPANKRVDCHPSPGANRSSCIQRNCVWDSAVDHMNKPTVPRCYMPSHSGYIITGRGTYGNYMQLNLSSAPYGAHNPYGTNISPITFQSTVGLAGLGITIGTGSRYRALVDLPRGGISAGESLYTEIIGEAPFAFAVKRKSTGVSIWDTSIDGLMFADQYIQIATYLPSTDIYGFGESVHLTLKHQFKTYTTQGMFARDTMPTTEKIWRNLYGVHAFYLGLEPDGKAHGVFILNSNPMEITTGPAPHLIYRTIGGMLEIQFFSGPTPEQVIQQYHQFIGLPTLPSYWSLGFQLCRYGYKSLNEVQTTIDHNLKLGIPIEVVYTDIDYMDRYKDFTVDRSTAWNDLPNYVRSLHQKNIYYVPIVDVGIQVDDPSFQRALQQNASFIEWETFAEVPEVNKNYSLTKNTKMMLGPVWPDYDCAFPDFLDSTRITGNWWSNEFVLFHKTLEFDGIWIDMNEPSVMETNVEKPSYWNNPRPKISTLKCPLNGTNSHYDMPPYQTWSVYAYEEYDGPNQASLSNQTICMLGLTNRQRNRVYDTKNLYGLYETIYTQQAVHKATGKRGYVLSRSTFPSSGHYGGHWLGDNFARFSSLQVSIIGIQEFNMFGIPYVGSDICGFNDNTTEELCLRWHQLGAFYSFMRNHNAIFNAPQDPAQWPSVAMAARQAILFRYYYLPYLFSLHFDVALNGGTVVRPVFFEFVNDSNARYIDHQFLWGSSMMIIPVVHEGQTSVTAYVPSGLWYSLRESDYGIIVVGNGNVTFSASTTDLIPVLVRGGSIIPRQRAEMTTTAARKNPFELLIAVSYSSLLTFNAPLNNTNVDVVANASGQLYWDDGESIINNMATYSYYHWLFNFVCTATKATLYIFPKKTNYALNIPTLDVIDIIGYPYCPCLHEAHINGQKKTLKSNAMHEKNRLLINATHLVDISHGKPIVISWRHGQCLSPDQGTRNRPHCPLI